MWDQWNAVFRDVLGPRRTQHRQRIAGRPQPVGAQRAIQQQRRHPGARFDGTVAERGLGRRGRGRSRPDAHGPHAGRVRRTTPLGDAQEIVPADRGQAPGRSEAVARSRHAASRRGLGPLPAGRIRRRPVAGLPGRRLRRVQAPDRVLPPDVPDRGLAPAADRRPCCDCPAREAIRSSSCRPTSAAARPTPSWRSITCSPARRRANCPASRNWSRNSASRFPKNVHRAVFVGTQISPGKPHKKPDGTVGPHPLGRDRLAARRQGRLQARQGGRRDGHEPRRLAEGALQQVRPLPDPDRRMGRLRPAVAHHGRPARRHVRDALHLRPGAERSGQGGQEHAAGREHSGFGKPAPKGRTRRDRHRSRRRTGPRSAWPG